MVQNGRLKCSMPNYESDYEHRLGVVLQGMSGQDGFGREVQAPCQTAGHLARFAECQARQEQQPISQL